MRSLQMQLWTQEIGWSSSHWYLRTATQRWSPSTVSLPRHPRHLRACDQWHPSHLAYPARILLGYAQRLLVLNQVLNIPTTTRRRVCLNLRPLRKLPPIPVERRGRHMILGDYTRKLNLYGARWSDFVQKVWYLSHRRAIRRGVDSLILYIWFCGGH